MIKSKNITSWNPGIISQLILRLLIIAAMAAISVLIIYNEKLIFLLITIPILLLSGYNIIKAYNYSLTKVAFMFNAIECDDYNFKFIDTTHNVNHYMLNNALNRIKEIMTETKLKTIEKEKYYELIMNSVRSGIMTINENGNIYQVNQETLKTLGISILTHIRQLTLIDNTLYTLIKEIKPGESKKIMITNERGEMQLSISAAGLLYNGKRMKIVSLNDINKAMDEKEAEAWIKLTRVLTHEIMNSLAPITSLSETLLKITEEHADNIAKNGQNKSTYLNTIGKGLETISTTGKSLISFVETYRKYTRLQNTVKTSFEIKPLIETAITLIKELNNAETISVTDTGRLNYHDKENDIFIKISLEIEPSEILVYADENMMRQVIINLLKNAWQAIVDKGNKIEGRIEISCRIKENEEVEINISNNGGAIPKAITEDIFTPFFTTKQQGTGVGLSVCRQIMHLHHGTIQLTSNTEENVCFTICL
jgi:nitrogen fixation/metabolism regulation signal transduction histidine kinase